MIASVIPPRVPVFSIAGAGALVQKYCPKSGFFHALRAIRPPKAQWFDGRSGSGLRFFKKNFKTMS